MRKKLREVLPPISKKRLLGVAAVLCAMTFGAHRIYTGGVSWRSALEWAIIVWGVWSVITLITLATKCVEWPELLDRPLTREEFERLRPDLGNEEFYRYRSSVAGSRH